jgi:adenosylhomocysteine nucleosidase
MTAPVTSLDSGIALTIAAVRTEAVALLPGATPAGVNLWQLPGEAGLLAITGMGRQRMAAAAADLIERFRPSLLINIGFAAGLDPALHGGQVLLIDEVAHTSGGSIRLEAASSPAFADALSHLPRSRLLTSDQLATTPAVKRRLYAAHGAGMLDMEAYGLAELAAEADIPLLVLKAVSDPAGMTLPPQVASWVDPQGNPRFWPATWFAMTHPHRVPALMTLSRHAARGAAALADGVTQLLHAAAQVHSEA